MDFEDARQPHSLLPSEARLVDETARRQEDYEFELELRLDEERHMHPNDRLDELGHEIFRLAIFKGENGRQAAAIAMKDPLARRIRIRDDLRSRVEHELDWYADDCHRDRWRPIHSVRDLIDDEGLIISNACCEDYLRITPHANRSQSSSRLRGEVRRRGRFVRRGSDYLRVAVHNRFVMHVTRSPDGLLQATALTPPRKRRRSRSRRAA